MGRAGRQEKLRPQEKCFFLDFLYGTYQELAPTGIESVGITGMSSQDWYGRGLLRTLKHVRNRWLRAHLD